MIDTKQSRRELALRLINEDSRSVASRLANTIGVSRSVAGQFLKGLVREGVIEGSGNTRSLTFRLTTMSECDKSFVREGLQEHEVFADVLSPLVTECSENARSIWEYVSTEIINNAIDHSGASQVRIRMRRTALFSELSVSDDGEGIFLKIQKALGLSHPRESILELVKGKLTTAPSHHTGEGIFFSSKMVDTFDIHSGGLQFSHDTNLFGKLSDTEKAAPGTEVRMRLENNSDTVMQDVFDRFTDPEDFTFEKTVIPVRLARIQGEGLVSRSQAKRVVNRFTDFKQVEMDFDGVDRVGFAFADEVFRVFASANPEVRLVPINVSPPVDKVIRRAVNARKQDQTA